MLVFQIEHANRAGLHHAARDKGAARNHQRIKRVAIGRKRVRDKAVIGRIAHRRVQNAIHEKRARIFVELILYRFAAGRNFYDDIEGFGWIVAYGDFVDTHEIAAFSCVWVSLPELRLPISRAPLMPQVCIAARGLLD